MPLTAKENSGANIEPIPPGVYVAVCYGLIDLGTHENKVFGGEAHKVLVQWETPQIRGEFERDGTKVSLPRAISKRYTLSLSEKANLRRDLESWRGRKFTAKELAGFDLKTLLGATCQLQIVHEASKEGRTYATIAAIMALPKGMPRPTAENPFLFFTFEDAAPGTLPPLPPGLPRWVTEVIAESKEWRAGLTGAAPAATPAATASVPAATDPAEEDVPF